jgi:hypothetical protein
MKSIQKGRPETTIRSSSILEDARKSLDAGLPVELEFTGPESRKIGRAVHHYLDHLDNRRSDAQRRLSFLKWALLADSWTELWGICTRARLNDMAVKGQTIRDSFFVRIGDHQKLE